MQAEGIRYAMKAASPPARSALGICCAVVAAGLHVAGDFAHVALGLRRHMVDLPPDRCHPLWGTDSGNRYKKAAPRACARETGIYILALEHGGAGDRLVPPVRPPLAGLGRVLGARGPPLCGALGPLK